MNPKLALWYLKYRRFLAPAVVVLVALAAVWFFWLRR